VSLLRLSLWADGECHTSLSAEEILFLTIAYDWFLFGYLYRTDICRRVFGSPLTPLLLFLSLLRTTAT